MVVQVNLRSSIIFASNMKLKNITSSLSFVFHILPHFLNSFLILLAYYEINSKITKLAVTTVNMNISMIDSLSQVVDKSFNKLTTIFIKDITENVTQLENELFAYNIIYISKCKVNTSVYKSTMKILLSEKT